MNNILIIGNGYVGNNLQNYLSSCGMSVKIVGRQDLDYHDQQVLGKYILNNDIKLIINCSGFTGRPNIDEAETKKELCWQLNVVSPLKVNEVCDKVGIKYIHISSGCIFDGYEKEWNETDVPNYGMFSPHSSFYSKSKHAFETLSQHLHGVIIRIRMPYHHDSSGRNYLTKIRSYNNLINFLNSKTYIPDLCIFVQNLIEKKKQWNDREIYNVVNPQPLKTDEVCEIMKKYNFHNSNWNFVPLASLKIATGRSNCVLNGDKAKEIYELRSESETLEECFQKMAERCRINDENDIKWMEENEYHHR